MTEQLMLSAIYMPTPPADSGVGTNSILYPGKSGLIKS
jgi:hypothetical protein